LNNEEALDPRPSADEVAPRPAPLLGSARAADALDRVRALLRLARMRFAHAVLLPDLSPDHAFDLRQTVRKDGELTSGYVLMCALSAGIATLGLWQSSTAVVIGAMLVSPLMSPIAALGFGFASLDGHRIKDAVRVVMVGAAIGILTGMLLTWLSPIRNATPEILARTEPTLLDLAIALFSGLAGGYATVIGKGGTAIGVAIATALMPPLTVVGYGIGVFQPMFALGAFLLFLTNLAAITFAVALVARLSNAARPFGKVEWTPRYIAILIAAFLALATPLSMTLMKITIEARIRAAARTAIISACGGGDGKGGVTIAQLDVKSSLFGVPKVDALVITRNYTVNATKDAEEKLNTALNRDVKVDLQQVLATDIAAQTRAMVDAAMERTTAGIAADVPPFDDIRAAIGMPTRSLWTDKAQRIVYVEPFAAPDWTLADYQSLEQAKSSAVKGWTIRITPPASSDLRIDLGPPPVDPDGSNNNPAKPPAAPDNVIPQSVAIWALQRWGLDQVVVEGSDADGIGKLAATLKNAGVNAVSDTDEAQDKKWPTPRLALIHLYAPSPAQRAAAAAKVAAEARAQQQQQQPGNTN